MIGRAVVEDVAWRSEVSIQSGRSVDFL